MYGGQIFFIYFSQNSMSPQTERNKPDIKENPKTVKQCHSSHLAFFVLEKPLLLHKNMNLY